MSLCRSFAVLGVACLVTTPVLAETATYRLTVDNIWSEATHPGAFPAGAHFSWLGGGTHTAGVSFWADGGLASPGMVQMAETGVTFTLVAEIAAAIGAGTAYQTVNWTHWFCPDDTTDSSCGKLVVEFEVDDGFPLVTLATMLGPSPDWFVGVSGLALHDGLNWINDLTVDLYPYDGGSREANAFALFGPLTIPQEPISLITAGSGQLVGPGLLGTFRFQRLGATAVPAMGAWATGVLMLALLAAGAMRCRSLGRLHPEDLDRTPSAS